MGEELTVEDLRRAKECLDRNSEYNNMATYDPYSMHSIPGSFTRIRVQCQRCGETYEFPSYKHSQVQCHRCGCLVSSMEYFAAQQMHQHSLNQHNKKNMSGCECERESELRKLSITQKMMLSKEDQSLFKAGFLSSELELTDKGRKAVFMMLFKEKKEELVKMAEELISEEESKK